jgi:hypothetical protein
LLILTKYLTVLTCALTPYREKFMGSYLKKIYPLQISLLKFKEVKADYSKNQTNPINTQ